MATAQDLIQDAFEKINVYAPGETINAADSSRGLSVLNDMLDSWSNESLSCYAITEQTLTYVPGQFAYTIGTSGGANVPLTRPIRLIANAGSAYTLDSNQNQYPMDVITREQWNQRGSRNTNSNFPDVLFYDPQFPLGILNFDPIPNIGYTAFWDSYLQLSDFAGLTTAVSLPPGYRLAIVDNLGIALSIYYADGKVPPPLVASARESKANVKRSNSRFNVSGVDPELQARAPGIYNIQNDSYRR